MLEEHTKRMRQKYVGSSDAAAICGKDPWRTAGDVYLEKTGRVPGFAGNAATEIGHYLEKGILDWTQAQLQTNLARDVFLVATDEIRCANLDGLAWGLSPSAVVEAKAIGLLRMPRYAEGFGEAGTDEVPDHIRIQVTHQMDVVNTSGGHGVGLAIIPVLLVGRGFVMFRVPYDPDLATAIAEREVRFWQDHVVADEPPPELPALDLLKERTRVPQKSVEISPALISEWVLTKAELKEATAIEERCKRHLLHALGDAEIGVAPGLGRVTFHAVDRKGYVVAPTTVRSLRFSAEKGKA